MFGHDRRNLTLYLLLGYITVSTHLFREDLKLYHARFLHPEKITTAKSSVTHSFSVAAVEGMCHFSISTLSQLADDHMATST